MGVTINLLATVGALTLIFAIIMYLSYLWDTHITEPRSLAQTRLNRLDDWVQRLDREVSYLETEVKAVKQRTTNPYSYGKGTEENL